MLKQSFSKITKVLTVLLAVLFVATMTVGAASACGSEHGSDCDHENHGCDGDHENHGCDGDHGYNNDEDDC